MLESAILKFVSLNIETILTLAARSTFFEIPKTVLRTGEVFEATAQDFADKLCIVEMQGTIFCTAATAGGGDVTGETSSGTR